MKWWTVFILSLLALSPARADYDSALSAYERGDYRTAREQLFPAARGGDPSAQYLLGRLYEQGLGTIQDYVEAHAWYNLAASRGRTEARQARERVEGRMTSDMIAHAQRRARDLSAGMPGEVSGPEAGYPGSGYAAPGDSAAGYPGSGYPEAPSGGSGYAGPGYPGPGAPGYGYPEPGYSDPGYPGAGYGEPAGPGAGYAEGGAPYAPPPLLYDDFADGDYTSDPAWTVTLGRFWVDPGLGLRSVETAAPALGDEDSQPGLAILGRILEQSAGVRMPLSMQEKARIHVPASIPDAFVLQAELSSRRPVGALALGVYQGPEQGVSYQVVYRPTGDPGLELQRVSGPQRVSLGRYPDALGLEGGAGHSLEWRRSASGTMRVSVDGSELLTVSDTRLRGPFDGLVVTNHGGDYALRRVWVEEAYE